MHRLTTYLFLWVAGFWITSCGETPAIAPGPSPVDTPAVDTMENYRRTLVSYLAQPTFSPPRMLEQVTGIKGQGLRVDATNGLLYLRIDEHPMDTQRVLSALTLKPERTTYFHPGTIGLQRFIPEDGWEKHSWIAFPWKDFKLEPETRICAPLPHYEFCLTLQDLERYSGYHNLWCGHVDAITSEMKYGATHIIANHGVMVARPDEPTLRRLTDQLTDPGDSKEVIAQKLLDFVTEELTYKESDVRSDMEIMKKPNEVLFTGGSDCSGLVILYASLLEQTEVDYRLIYLTDHILVGVEGDYGNKNGLVFKFDGNPYALAECTAHGFQIGTSRLTQRIGHGDIRYYQHPGEGSKILRYLTAEPLPFGNVVMKPQS